MVCRLYNRSLSASEGWLTVSELRGRHSTRHGDKPQSQDVGGLELRCESEVPIP